MAWRYRAIETQNGVGVCVYTEGRDRLKTNTDAIAPTATNTVELVRVLEMMVEDLKRNEPPVKGGPHRGRYNNRPQNSAA